MNVFRLQPAVTSELFEQHLSHAGVSRPAMVICETVNACNLDCIICAYSLQQRPKTLMPMSLFEKVLDDYSAMGGGSPSLPPSLPPTVGDVLLDRRLAARMDAIRRHSEISAVSFTTNAVLAPTWDRHELASVIAGMRRIQVSVYGLDSGEYEQMTRRDKFAGMLAAVHMVAELRQSGTELVLGFRLLKSRSREELADWVRDQFGEDLEFGASTTYGNWGVLDTSRPLPVDAKWVEIRYNKGQCAIPLLALQISSDGGVSFCPCDDFQSAEELKLGNVRDATLLSMYNTAKVARLDDFASHIPNFCRSCSFWQPLENSIQVANLFHDPIASIGG